MNQQIPPGTPTHPAGWFPDPDGTPGRVRYWDGTTWTDHTAEQAPNFVPGARIPFGPTHQQRSGLRALATAGAVVLLGGVLSAIVLRPGAAAHEDLPPLPPLTSAPSPASTPSATPQTSPCPSGSGGMTSQRGSGRLVSGPLSMTAPGWGPGVLMFDFTYQTAMQQTPGPANWSHVVMVGQLRRSDGFTTPPEATRKFMACWASNAYFPTMRERKDVHDSPLQVSGRTAHKLVSEILVDKRTAPGSRTTIIVVDTGDKEHLSFMMSGVVIGDTRDRTTLEKLEKTLEVGA